MNKLFFLFLVTLLAVACSPEKQAAQEQPETTSSEVVEAKMTFPADSVSPDGNMSFHGLRIADDGAIGLDELSAKANEAGEITPVKVSGTVDAVCQAKGCWMTMQMADGSDMRIRFKDYGFFVPKDASGKTAVVEGRAYLDTTSVEDLRHYAVDGGMTEEAAAEKFTEPELSLAFEATGVVIKEAEGK